MHNVGHQQALSAKSIHDRPLWSLPSFRALTTSLKAVSWARGSIQRRDPQISALTRCDAFEGSPVDCFRHRIGQVISTSMLDGGFTWIVCLMQVSC